MGFVYKITAPTGEIYVGQTIRTIDQRWQFHCSRARLCKSQLICQRIREYGSEAFTIEVLEEVANNDLHAVEARYIRELNTITPNGLNMSSGGGISKVDSFRTRRSKASRKHTPEGFELPVNVKALKKGDEFVGFRVDIPGHEGRRFSNPKNSLQENYDATMEIYNQLMEGMEMLSVSDEDLPTYVTWNEKRHKYRVVVPGYPERGFGSLRMTREQRRDAAINYLNDILDGKVNKKESIVD